MHDKFSLYIVFFSHSQFSQESRKIHSTDMLELSDAFLKPFLHKEVAIPPNTDSLLRYLCDYKGVVLLSVTDR